MASNTLRDFFTYYTLEQELGTGASSVVYECREKCTSNRRAVKVCQNNSSTSLAVLQRESIILTKLDHKHIIKSYGLYTDENERIYTVLELIDGGELYEILDEFGALSERDSQAIAHQLLMAIFYLHNHNIVHRDVKPENVLLNEHGLLKLADFGFAVQTNPDDPTVIGCVGTHSYQAPEILLDIAYTNAVDMWSFGVTIFTILSATKPFPNTGKERSKQRAKILNGDFNFDDKVWSHISEDAKDFITKLLNIKSTERMTAEEATEHPWLTGNINLKAFGDRWESKVQLQNQSKKRKNDRTEKRSTRLVPPDRNRDYIGERSRNGNQDSVIREISRDHSRGLSHDTIHDFSLKISLRDMSKDTSSRGISSARGTSLSRENLLSSRSPRCSLDPSRDYSHGHSRDSSRDYSSRDSSRDHYSHAHSRDSSRDYSHSHSRDSSRDYRKTYDTSTIKTLPSSHKFSLTTSTIERKSEHSNRRRIYDTKYTEKVLELDKHHSPSRFLASSTMVSSRSTSSLPTVVTTPRKK